MLTVNLAEYSYDIHTGSDSLALIGKYCGDIGLTSRAAIITNPTVNTLYGETVRHSLEKTGISNSTIEIPDGEEYKNFETLSAVYNALINAGLDRTSFIVALGGGVVGDLAGFAAATYLRGIPFVQIPTTLLAQVDSSVGGKTAIDHPRGKNLIGAFYQPRLVMIDVDTLSTLSERHYRAGLAEVIKYGVTFDETFFEYLEQHVSAILSLDKQCLFDIIQRCCEIKAFVVEQDERESGLRAALNYGHTFGHAFEAVSAYSGLVHGEAIAVGMILAAKVSQELGHCSKDVVSRIESLVSRFGFSISPPSCDRRNLLDAIKKDKKSNNGSIRFVCNQDIGRYVIEQLDTEKLLTLSGLEV